MSPFLKTLPLVAALLAAPAFAAEPDPRAGHHPAKAAEAAKPAPKPDAKSNMHACPMMEGKTAADADAGALAGKAPEAKMMDGKDMHCMPATASAKAPEGAHDHDHPETAPK